MSVPLPMALEDLIQLGAYQRIIEHPGLSFDEKVGFILARVAEGHIEQIESFPALAGQIRAVLMSARSDKLKKAVHASEARETHVIKKRTESVLTPAVRAEQIVEVKRRLKTAQQQYEAGTNPHALDNIIRLGHQLARLEGTSK